MKRIKKSKKELLREIDKLHPDLDTNSLARTNVANLISLRQLLNTKN